MIYDWIQEFTGIVTNQSGTYQNTYIQQTACMIMLMIIIFMLWAGVKVLGKLFHWD
jgi:hypothetical protein